MEEKPSLPGVLCEAEITQAGLEAVEASFQQVEDHRLCGNSHPAEHSALLSKLLSQNSRDLLLSLGSQSTVDEVARAGRLTASELAGDLARMLSVRATCVETRVDACASALHSLHFALGLSC